jgi:hypothetical protein
MLIVNDLYAQLGRLYVVYRELKFPIFGESKHQLNKYRRPYFILSEN